MNDLILTKMREGDWGAVVRLMRECGLTVVGDFANTADNVCRVVCSMIIF